MVNQRHYICDICFQYIRPNQGDKLVSRKRLYGYDKRGKLITIGRTKAHRDCIMGIKTKSWHSKSIKMVMEHT